ncbi:MAG TPA: hypothetical protein VEZ47_03935, partial [Gemmatirosa sp.]|nr:hypothetical protein [Gemmatirosa sp.]
MPEAADAEAPLAPAAREERPPRLAAPRFAVLRLAVPLRFAVLRLLLDDLRAVPARLAVPRLAVLRLAVPLRFAVLRLAVLLRFAVLRLAVLRLAVLLRFAVLRLAVPRFAAPPLDRLAPLDALRADDFRAVDLRPPLLLPFAEAEAPLPLFRAAPLRERPVDEPFDELEDFDRVAMWDLLVGGVPRAVARIRRSLRPGKRLSARNPHFAPKSARAGTRGAACVAARRLASFPARRAARTTSGPRRVHDAPRTATTERADAAPRTAHDTRRGRTPRHPGSRARPRARRLRRRRGHPR